MQSVAVTRDTFAEAIRESGIRLELLAALTGKSFHAVYRYMNGTRRPPDEWIAKVETILLTREMGGTQ